MAKVLTDHTFSFNRGRAKKYPDEWITDGKVRLLTEGEDFSKGKAESCASILRVRARSFGMSSHLQISEDKKTITFQAYKKDGKPVETKKEVKKPATKRVRKAVDKK